MPINSTPDIHQLVICANIFIRKDGTYLVLKRSPEKKYAPNVIHPFDGKVDLNENPFIAAQREVLEEVGIKVKNMRLEAVILEISPQPGMPENWLVFHFSADYDSGEVITTNEGEFVYLTPEELKNSSLFPSVRRIIEHIINPKDGAVFATFRYDDSQQIIEEKSSVDLCVI